MPLQSGLFGKLSSFPPKASKQRINANQTRKERINNTTGYWHKKFAFTDIRIRFIKQNIINNIFY